MPRKVGILAWTAEMERILSLLSLSRRLITMELVQCPIYGDVEESVDHLYVMCRFSQSIWDVIACSCKLLDFFLFFSSGCS